MIFIFLNIITKLELRSLFKMGIFNSKHLPLPMNEVFEADADEGIVIVGDLPKGIIQYLSGNGFRYEFYSDGEEEE